jgi:hypothetical protein
VQVAHHSRRIVGVDVARLDVDAAGEGEAAVHREHLAVRAEIEEREPGVADTRQEERRGCPACRIARCTGGHV